ncbi:MAG: hypothetical protein CMI53_04765 [Parcubacteria group bacterium]|nr:hypothetical protein [Parcubacteria group bacterium]|tara:strand:+ start:8541 stop:9122 length:582 start_codon:yes stop_codon:yes gene_type:complete
MKVIIQISGRHCHISRKDLDIVYGKGYKLKPIKKLSQTGQFASQETVTIKVGNKKIEDIRILGPVRKNTQVEISLSGGHRLNIKPPIIRHVHPESAGGCIPAEIIGPNGKVRSCAIIAARRHLHTNPKTAKKLKIKDGQLISLKTSGKRSVIFNNILVRVHPSFKTRVHLDTDEGNAAGLIGGEKGELMLNNS